MSAWSVSRHAPLVIEGKRKASGQPGGDVNYADDPSAFIRLLGDQRARIAALPRGSDLRRQLSAWLRQVDALRRRFGGPLQFVVCNREPEMPPGQPLPGDCKIYRRNDLFRYDVEPVIRNGRPDLRLASPTGNSAFPSLSAQYEVVGVDVISTRDGGPFPPRPGAEYVALDGTDTPMHSVGDVVPMESQFGNIEFFQLPLLCDDEEDLPDDLTEGVLMCASAPGSDPVAWMAASVLYDEGSDDEEVVSGDDSETVADPALADSQQ